MLAAELRSWRELRQEAAPFLRGVEPLGFDHQIIRLEAELAWHDAALKQLPELLAQRASQDQEQAHE